MRTTDRRAEDVIEDVEFILEHEPRETAGHISARLGYRSKTGLQKALAGRPDLLARLKRNAELAS